MRIAFVRSFGEGQGTEVIEGGFGVAFFAGEFVGKRGVLGWAVVHTCQGVVALESCVVGVGFALSFLGVASSP
jgi:hypothetical protein